MLPTARPLIIDRPALEIFPLGASQNVATSAAAAWSTALNWRTAAVRLMTTANARVAVGDAPTAVAASTLIAPADPLIIRINDDQRLYRGIVDVATNVFRFFRWDGRLNAADSSPGDQQDTLTTGQVIYFLAQGGAVLPAPLAIETPYYVRSDGTISASTTGITPGAALDITTAGSGPWLAVTSDRISLLQDTAAGNVNITELR